MKSPVTHRSAGVTAGTSRRMLPDTRVTAYCALLGLAVGVLVVAPWVRGGYLLLLDWVSGPQQTLTPGVYGLSGSALDAMPFRIGTQALRRLVGSAATAWLLILAYFPIAAAGASVAAGGTRWRRYAAALFIVCNPVVVDRIRVGHVSFLLAIALLPWLYAALLHARKRNSWFSVRPALWYALAISINPHAAWLGGLMVLVVTFVPKPSWRALVRALQVVAAAGLVYGYALILWLTNTRVLNVTEADLQVYATQSGPGGLLPTVASLHGFWRADPDTTVQAWLGGIGVLLFAVLIAGVVFGAAMLWRREVDRAAPLVVIGVLGMLLAAGINGPLGGPYRWAFDHVPLFEAMREQQKWIALVLLAYAVFFGSAVEWLAHRVPRREFALPALVLPLVMAPTLVWGLGGTITTSQYPKGWWAANFVMGRGQGLALFLPWHAYQPFAFSQGRTIATPSNAFFRRNVLTSDAVELPGLRTDSTSLRTGYVSRLVADGGGGAFGRLVAPLGVEYVVLAKTTEAVDYAWVGEQPDLQQVLDTETMTVYRVLAEGTGRVVQRRVATYEELLAEAAAGGVGSEAVTPGIADTATTPSDAAGDIQKAGETTWTVAAGTPGWTVIPEEFSPGWQVGGRSGEPTVAGTIAFDLRGEPATVTYEPWRYLLPATLASLAALAGLVAAGVWAHRQDVVATLQRSGQAGPPGP
ncbi:MAG: hypothetical protein V9E82_14080 [Candidatus Nanopelagicales bacterium]